MKAEILAMFIIVACMMFVIGYCVGMTAKEPQEYGSGITSH